jgi:hypothetical protein
MRNNSEVQKVYWRSYLANNKDGKRTRNIAEEALH